jgi:hypothetical protein
MAVDQAVLSDDFLRTYRVRLDAIGMWTATRDDGTRTIRWERPPVLDCRWVPLDLLFETNQPYGHVTDFFDPDERMFELWDLFVSRRDEFIGQLQAEVAEAVASEGGRLVRGEVHVSRQGAGGRVRKEHRMHVEFYFVGARSYSRGLRPRSNTRYGT